MKQSSIEWLIDQLEKHYVKTDLKNTVAYQRAKAMHKEEIMDAHGEEQDYLEDDGSWRRQTAEQYYNETFNTKEK
jgi:hypothetical protein